jgi:hypothetical protein
MRTLELKDICGYLPYSLYGLYKTKEYKYISLSNRKTECFAGIERIINNCAYNNICAIETIKPILRPLSELYRKITHNGEEIIPIVECAKIYKPHLRWEQNKETASSKFYKFGYDYELGFYCFFGETHQINNPYQLFDYLHELKIDYRNLIDAGLAVNANTLDINPYK